MRAFLIVIMFFGAFLSVAGINKVFSEQPTKPLLQSIMIDPLTFDPVATTSAGEEVPIVPFAITTTLLPIATSSSQQASSAATPEPDFCLDIPVVMYHHTEPLETAGLLGHAQLTVDSNIFDEQMKYLVDNGYTFISAEELIHALLNRKKLSEKTIVITIDDGYKDNYTYAFLVAKKYKIVMNFMIPTELVGKADYLTWDHLKEMIQSPYAKIYNHTATHAGLGYLSTEQIDWELATSSAALQAKLGLKNTVFTYPYGSFSDLAIEKVKDYGFIGAYTTIEGKHQCQSTIMQLQRLRVGNAPMASYGF